MANMQQALLAGAFLLALAESIKALAIQSVSVQQVRVTASPFRAVVSDQILSPAKVVGGDELRAKIGTSLGETLAQELRVSATAFSAGASRPIIRGLECSRVKMLENGISVADVFGLANDHGVAAEGAVAQQIEILRGPAALLQGSGAIGGLDNVVNGRYPSAWSAKPAARSKPARVQSTAARTHPACSTLRWASWPCTWMETGAIRAITASAQTG